MSAPGSTQTLRIHAEDPSRLLEAAFRRIEAETMADVPILNPALQVEAVGFTRWQGHWLGIVITPWFMNLVLVPGAAESWQSVAPGLRLFRNFPSGDFAFLGSNEPEVGELAHGGKQRAGLELADLGLIAAEAGEIGRGEVADTAQARRHAPPRFGRGPHPPPVP